LFFSCMPEYRPSHEIQPRIVQLDPSSNLPCHRSTPHSNFQAIAGIFSYCHSQLFGTSRPNVRCPTSRRHRPPKSFLSHGATSFTCLQSARNRLGIPLPLISYNLKIGGGSATAQHSILLNVHPQMQLYLLSNFQATYNYAAWGRRRPRDLAEINRLTLSLVASVWLSTQYNEV
jgi:hypothetical protein